MKRLLALLLLPLPALAETAPQDVLTARYRAQTDACTQAAERPSLIEPCYDLLTAACIAGEADGQTTQGMAQCIQAEHRYWDEALNREYQAVRADLVRSDAADQPEYAHRADRLRDAQRAWIAFRDAQCALDYSLWGNGSMRLLSGASCQARRTFDRVRDLIALRDR